MKNIITKIVSNITKVEVEDLELNMDLFEEDLLDSLAIIMLVGELSDEFDVELDVGFLERSQMSTINNINDTIIEMKG
ncbi:MAG: acyl carrier protein [Lachnospirales bacterium]